MGSKSARRKRRNRGPQAQVPSTAQTVKKLDLAAENERLRAELARVAPWAQQRNDALSDMASDIETAQGRLAEHAEEVSDLMGALSRTGETVRELMSALRNNADNVGVMLEVAAPEVSPDEFRVPAVGRAMDHLRDRVARLTAELTVAKRAPHWARRIMRGGYRLSDKLVTFSTSALATPAMMDVPTREAVFQIGLRLLREANLAEHTNGDDELGREPDKHAIPDMTTVEEIGAFFGVSERTVRRWLKDGVDCGVTATGEGASRTYSVDPDRALAYKAEREAS